MKYKVFEILKIMVLLIFPFMISINLGNYSFLMSALFSIVTIFGICTILKCRWKKIAIILNGLLYFLMCIQYLVKYFSNSFISLQMLTNLGSLEDISGKFYIYIPCILVSIIFCFIPTAISKFEETKYIKKILVCIIVSVLINFSLFKQYNSYYAYFDLIVQKIELNNMKNKISNNNSLDVANFFYKEEIDDYIKSEFKMKKPNVILIFAEGFSQNIVEDERDITPNIRELEKSSIYFSNYYNHTFATYMGLSGQLYSGFQQNNYDNNKLVSLQDIMKLSGYSTYFINTEPKNEDFSNYLTEMKFDNIITQTDNLNGMYESISDKDTYDLLFNLAKDKEADSPFFIGVYTFGTHVGMDSVDLKFENGNNAMLNKAYNMDYFLGDFLEKFNDSSLADNTILIFTTDHASYKDQDYSNAFPNYERKSTMIDEIPLCIYFKGIQPKIIDVNGRNSLDLAPTICDYLDLEGENYFLGKSLFASDDSVNFYETKFQSLSDYMQTADSKIDYIENIDELNKFKDEVAMYFSAKLLDESIHKEYIDKTRMSVYQDKDNLIIDMDNMKNIDLLNIAVWSTKDEQDDIKWYSYNVDSEKCSYKIGLDDFTDTGEYACHIYGYDKNKKETFFEGQYLNVKKW